MNTKTPIWTFPANHAIKAIGLDTDPVRKSMIEILEELALPFNRQTLRSKKSANGKYISITIEVRLNSMSEVEQLYARLHAHPHIVQSL